MLSLSTNLVQDVYDDAAALFAAENHHRPKKEAWISNKHSLKDIQEAVRQAQNLYSTKESSRAYKWLQAFSSRFMYYGKIMDMLAQQHPEYVSLGWGTLKFIFVVALNHEETIAELAKALAHISDALPRVEIQLNLYHTDEMQALVLELYHVIIRFYSRAISWYRKGKISHFFEAVIRPFPLHFKELLNEVNDSSRKIEKLAAVMAQLELRKMHEVTQQTSQGQTDIMAMLTQLRKLMIENQAVNERRHLDTYRSTREIQVAQMISIVSENTMPHPLKSIRYAQAMRALRARGRTPPPNFDHLMPTLNAWAASPISSLLAVKGSLSTRTAVTDLVVDMIGLIHSSQAPIVWALKGKSNISSSNDTAIHLLKCLVMQTLQLNSEIVGQISPSFNAAMLQCAQTEKDWLAILRIIAVSLPKLYIIIDLELLEGGSNDRQWAISFLQGLQEFIKINKDLQLKVVLFSFRQLLDTSGITSDAKNAIDGVTHRAIYTPRQSTLAARSFAGRGSSRGYRGKNKLRGFIEP